MGIVALGHVRVGVPELARDDRHRDGKTKTLTAKTGVRSLGARLVVERAIADSTLVQCASKKPRTYCEKRKASAELGEFVGTFMGQVATRM